MEIPSISLRRNPTFAMIGLAGGLGMAAIGIYLGLFYLVFPGVMVVLIAALYTLNPFAIVTHRKIEIRSLFGNSVGTYDHDGLHLMQIQDGKLTIQKGQYRAAVNRISQKTVQAGYWRALEAAIEGAKAAKTKSKS